MRTLRFLLVLALAGSLCAGCAGKSKPADGSTPAAARPAPTPKPASTPKPNRPKVGILSQIAYWSNPFNLLPKKAKPPVAQQPRLIGDIRMVNLDDKYVLVDAVSQNAAPGDLLVCITAQRETANLRMSTMKNPPFLIADIASGTPSVGDRVFKP